MIKSRGPNEEGLEFAAAGDIVTIAPDATLLAAAEGLFPPNECHIHLGVYRARPDVMCVVHVHLPSIVALGAVGRKLLPLYGAYDPAGLQLALDGIAYYPRSILISSPELGADVATALGAKSACILAGHGIVTAGPSIEAAILTAIAIAELGKINLTAAEIGEPQSISAEDQATFRQFFAGLGPRIFSGRTDTGEPADWHYYAKRDAARQRAAGNA
jgi:ribulose-5-phosphate 4-epimerase/fuculose-1-phosphate aldolase